MLHKGKGYEYCFLKNIAVYRGKAQLNMNNKVHPIGKICSTRDYWGMKIRTWYKSTKMGRITCLWQLPNFSFPALISHLHIPCTPNPINLTSLNKSNPSHIYVFLYTTSFYPKCSPVHSIFCSAFFIFKDEAQTSYPLWSKHCLTPLGN